MFQQQDAAHLKVMGEMRDLMQKPEAMKEWFESKQVQFEALSED